jgi:glycosyltransferase involved in cell wall biosynthesis
LRPELPESKVELITTPDLHVVELRARERTPAVAGELEEARQRIAELLTDNLAHTQARLALETLLRLPKHAADEAAKRANNLRAWARSIARVVEQSHAQPASRAGRLWATLRALGVTPGRILHDPRQLKTLAFLVAQPRRLREAHVIAQSGVFDAARYYGRTPEHAANGLTPLAHFVLSGPAARRAPHALFDPQWYLSKYQDVARSGANPLAHYLRTGAAELRDPHPLFSSKHYRAQVAANAPDGFDPLRHYVAHGLFEERSPHPLFDARYYVESYGDRIQGVDPFVHFLESGADQDFNPHPLFDSRYYRKQMKGLGTSSVNPLMHYLESGVANGLQPHPLFDPAFYLASYRDVAASGLEPLTHFVTVGGAEGRRPVPEFDSAWYLMTYPDVTQSGDNPLVHYIRHGWLERRNPSPNFDTITYLTHSPDVAAAGDNPLAHFVERGRREGRIAVPSQEPEDIRPPHEDRLWLRATNLDGAARVGGVVVCLTHVMPVPPRAGNEYRIHRMLRWMRDSGYVVIPVVAPTRGETTPTADEIRAVAAEYGNAVVCTADGRVQYVLRDVPDVLQSLEGDFPRRWSTVLGEDRPLGSQERDLLEMDHSYCSDALISTVLRLQSALGPHVLLAEYIWMSRILPLARPHALKVIDTHDVFSKRTEKVAQFGIQDLCIDPSAEQMRLSRADLVIAIQDNERRDLEQLTPAVPVVTAGVDFDVIADPGAPATRRVLYVASANAINKRGLKDFLKFAWPRLRERIPDAELMIVGGVAESFHNLPAGVIRAGRIAELAPAYRDARVVINPAVAGTGLKIKTLEALAHLRPIVTWPNGVDGLSPRLASFCHIVGDWYAFSTKVGDILLDERENWFSIEDREAIAREGATDVVYGELGRRIKTFFEAAGQIVNVQERR